MQNVAEAYQIGKERIAGGNDEEGRALASHLPDRTKGTVIRNGGKSGHDGRERVMG